ncbi:MAG: RecB family exonuclease [Candidatus Aminicenantales bacterium]
MASFSISKISTFLACPLQYKFAYVDNVKVEVEETIETFLGRMVHEALEKLYRDKMHEKLLSSDELLDYYRQNWLQKWPGAVIQVKKDYTPENYLRMGERYLKDYYNRHKPFERGRIIALETKELIPLDENGDYLFHVRIDRLVDMGEGIYEIHDYKTSSLLPTQKELDEDKQLAAYALWVKSRFKDFQKARLVWHYLAFDKEMDTWRTADELEALRREILAQIQAIEQTKEFSAVVSSLCNWCIYRQLCPMWKHGVDLEMKTSNEFLCDPGAKLVDEYVRIKSELERFSHEAQEKLEKIKEALLAFSQKEKVAVVFGSENKITIKEQMSLQLPAKNTEERRRLIEILKQSGKWDEVADLDVAALSRILKNQEWDKALLGVLEGFGMAEKSYRFIVSKK